MPGQRINEFGEIVDDNAPASSPVGVAAPPVATAPITNNKPKSNKSEWWLLTIGFAMVSLILIGLGSYFWYDGYNRVNTPTPTVKPITVGPTTTPDPLSGQLSSAVIFFNNGDYPNAIKNLNPLVKQNPAYQNKAALLLFTSIVRQAEIEAVSPTDFNAAPTDFQTAINLANANKTELEQQYQNGSNSALLPSSFNTFDLWLIQVQKEATWATDFQQAQTSSDPTVKISKLEDIYKDNPDYLHNTSAGGNDNWVAVLLYNAYANQNDALCESQKPDQAKTMLARPIQILAENKAKGLQDIYHLQQRLQNGGCS